MLQKGTLLTLLLLLNKSFITVGFFFKFKFAYWNTVLTITVFLINL